MNVLPNPLMRRADRMKIECFIYVPHRKKSVDDAQGVNMVLELSDYENAPGAVQSR